MLEHHDRRHLVRAHVGLERLTVRPTWPKRPALRQRVHMVPMLHGVAGKDRRHIAEMGLAFGLRPEQHIRTTRLVLRMRTKGAREHQRRKHVTNGFFHVPAEPGEKSPS